MDITINYNVVDDVCEGTTDVDITSTLITGYVAQLPTPDHTLDLIVEYLDGDAITISITDANPNLDTGTNTYTLTPSDVNQVDSLSDGVYNLKLVKTLTIDGSTTTEFKCMFIDCKVSCKVKTYNVNQEDAKAGVLYSILTVQDNCGSCSCDNNVEIYNKLDDLLTTTNSCDC